jgi:hypothetical protein
MTHTPGPWKAQRKDKHSGMHITAGHFQVFLGTHTGAPLEEWDANARLIASAPELLAKLEACDKAIRAVIGDGPVRGNGTPYPIWADMITAAVEARAAITKATD